MFEPPHKSQRSDESPQRHPALDELRTIPGNVFDTILGNEDDSRVAIADAVAEAMTQRGISVWELHEQSGLSCEVIDSVLEGRMDLRDSKVLTTIQAALQVRLAHL